MTARCDACGKVVSIDRYRALNEREGRCAICSERGVPYGEYLRAQKTAHASSVDEKEKCGQSEGEKP